MLSCSDDELMTTTWLLNGLSVVDVAAAGQKRLSLLSQCGHSVLTKSSEWSSMANRTLLLIAKALLWHQYFKIHRQNISTADDEGSHIAPRPCKCP